MYLFVIETSYKNHFRYTDTYFILNIYITTKIPKSVAIVLIPAVAVKIPSLLPSLLLQDTKAYEKITTKIDCRINTLILCVGAFCAASTSLQCLT